MSFIIFEEQAFAKLLWFRRNCHENNVFDTKYTKSDFIEVSLMGVSKAEQGEELLTVEDFVCVPQECTSGLTEPTDEGMAIYFEEMMFDREISPNRCGRIWAHTHPGSSPTPSGTDRETFSKWFKDAEFAVMYILADGNDHCELKHMSKQLGSQKVISSGYVLLNKKDSSDKPMYISTRFIFEMDKLSEKMQEAYGSFTQSVVFDDYSHLHEEWMAELKRCVKKKSYHTVHTTNTQHSNITTSKDVTAPTINRIGFGMSKKERKRLNKQDNKNHTDNFGIDTLLRVLIRNKKNTINELGHKGIEAIAEHFKTSVSKVHQTYSNLIQFEKFCTEESVLDNLEHLIISGKNAIKENVIPEAMLTQICVEISARPAHISEIVDDLLTKVASDV